MIGRGVRRLVVVAPHPRVAHAAARLRRHAHASHAPFAAPSHAGVDDVEVFRRAIGDLLELVQCRLESLDAGERFVDLNCVSGVLSVQVDGAGVWIFNQHNVTRQCWLSSPISGPSKWNWHADLGQWRNERDASQRLQAVLEGEFSDTLEQRVTFEETF